MRFDVFVVGDCLGERIVVFYFLGYSAGYSC